MIITKYFVKYLVYQNLKVKLKKERKENVF